MSREAVPKHVWMQRVFAELPLRNAFNAALYGARTEWFWCRSRVTASCQPVDSDVRVASASVLLHNAFPRHKPTFIALAQYINKPLGKVKISYPQIHYFAKP